MHDLMPPDAAGQRLPNADPVTGQAAGLDLRVRIERLGPRRRSLPQFPGVALKILRRSKP
jgi:hypothetical protein